MNKIEKEITSNIEKFKQIVNQSNSTGEICKKYNFSDNGKTRDLIKDFIIQYSLSTIHFGLKNHPIKYILIKKICPQCKCLFETQDKHPREKTCCSRKCSNKYNKQIYTISRKQKISNSLKKFYLSEDGKNLILKQNKIVIVNKQCKYCNNLFSPKSIKINYCSKSCNTKCPEYREKLRQAQLKRVAEGTHSGWKSRNQPSYAELFFMKVLANNNISYKFEEPCGKYFIDFAIHDKQIALEIDGKQHLQKDRKISDEIKDEFLYSQGWKVYRIPWKSINSKTGKAFIENEINNFLQYYKKF